MRKRVILIAGPTASGKSALALRLAQGAGGAVVNADSMQVYHDLRVLTARPTPQEEQTVPHLLFGHVDAAVNYSVGRWLEDLRKALAELYARELVPVIAGGTGMYFKAALQGLSDIPAVPEAVREEIRREAQGRTPQELHAELARRDPETAARLRPTDPQRILRALEIFEATGKPLASFQRARKPPLLDAAQCDAFFIAPERDTLIARAKADTRHYAKRQFTFARHQLPGFRWLEGDAAGSQALTALGC